MSDTNHTDLRLTMNPVALSSYAVAICSIAGAFLGLVSSHFPSGGLAAVGGFYLVVGAVSQLTAKSPITQSTHQIGGHTSGAENLVAEAMVGTREAVSTATGQRDLVAVSR